MRSNHAKFKWIDVLVFIVCICLIVLYYIGLGNMKMDYHTDEYYTYQIANSYSPYWQIPQYEWFSSNKLTEQLMVNRDSKFSISDVIEKETYDMHPFMYTLMVHLLCSLIPGQFSQWVGLGINILFVVLTMIMLYLCLRRLSVRKASSLVAAIVFGCCYGTASQVMFIRMYVIVMFFAVCVVYLHIKYWQSPNNWCFNIWLAVVSIYGALTHYYFVLFLVLCCIVYGIVLLAKNKTRAFLQYLITEIISGACAIALFPAMINQVFGRGVGYSETSSISYWDKLITFSSFFNRDVFGGILWVLVCLITIVFFYSYNRNANTIDSPKEEKGIIAFLTIPPIAFILVIAQISPYLTARYVSAVFPIAILVVFYALEKAMIKANVNHYIAAIMAVVVGTICIGGSHYQRDIDSLYLYREPILSRTEKRENRNALLLIDDECVWPIPSALSELKDYNNLLVIPYSSIENESTMDLLKEAGDYFNLYCYTWNVSEELREKKMQELMEMTQMESTYLWDSFYCVVYECTPIVQGGEAP